MSNKIDPKWLIDRISISELCRKAEEYFQKITDPTYQMSKPFAGFIEAPELLYRLGLLIAGLKLGKTMTILDFGAGTCWLSRIFNQLQCSTISVDPSLTALNIGKKLFNEFPIIGQYIEPPKFLHFNGHHIEIEDISVDRIICFDVFHHISNQKEILREFFRVLKPGGIAGFSEPGRYHSQSPQSQYEMKNYGVLENDILIEEIREISQEIGFSRLYLKPIINYDLDLEYEDYSGIIFERNIPSYVSETIVNAMASSTVFFLTKGEYIPDSRSHFGLKHHIEIEGDNFRTRVNEPLTLEVKIKNLGDAKWLSSNVRDIGVVKLGAHLYDNKGNLIDLDFYRSMFERDILPGEEVTKLISILFAERGTYNLSIDLVSEQICWFENVDSIPKSLRVLVK